MKSGDLLIQQVKGRMIQAGTKPYQGLTMAYVTVYASEGLTTRDMTNNYEFGMAHYFISQVNFNAGRN